MIYQDVVRNYFANDRINKALDAVIDPATGLPACRSDLKLCRSSHTRCHFGSIAR